MTATEYILPPAELLKLTGKVQAAKQVRWLAAHNIPHKVDGTRVIVSSRHVDAWLENRPVIAASGPNWGAVNA